MLFVCSVACFSFLIQVLRSYDSRLRPTQRRPDVYLIPELVGQVRILYRFADTNASDVSEGGARRCRKPAWLWEERGCLVILVTKHHEGRHWTESFSECVGVVQNLKTFHMDGYVHGDIRAFNIIFGANELIDYDFAGKVNQAEGTPKYPFGYKQILRDGTRFGVEGRPITMYDDWYSLLMVLTHVHKIVPIAPCAVQADELDAKMSEFENCEGLPVEELTKEGGVVEGVASAAVNLLETAEAKGCSIAPEKGFLQYLQCIGFYQEKKDIAEEGARVRDASETATGSPDKVQKRS